MPRPIWKGFISFGLVNIPCELGSLEAPERDIDFSMLDKRDHARIRYQRVNERTGKEVDWKDIVKGHEVGENEYVIVSQEDIKRAAPKTTKTIEIQGFLDGGAVAPWYYKRPYILLPGKQGEKGYHILRSTLGHTKRVGLASIVLHTRQHLALVMPIDNALILNTVRYEEELRSITDFEVPTGAKPSKGELDVAATLVETMSIDWEPAKYHDEYRSVLMKWIEQRAKKGIRAAAPEEEEEAEVAGPYNIMEMLKKSVESQKSARTGKRTAHRRKAG